MFNVHPVLDNVRAAVKESIKELINLQTQDIEKDQGGYFTVEVAKMIVVLMELKQTIEKIR